MKEFFRAAFSENGEPSSKRIIGGVSMIAMVVSVIIMACTNGCNECVKSMVETIVLASMALLGISSITSVFKK